MNDAVTYLRRPLQFIKGVGPGLSKVLEKLAGPEVRHLLWHLPTRFETTYFWPFIPFDGDKKTGRLKVAPTASLGSPRSRVLSFAVVDEKGTPLKIVFFKTPHPATLKILASGEPFYIQGILEKKDLGWQMVHPRVLDEYTLDENTKAPSLTSVYPSTATLPQWKIRTLIQEALGGLSTSMEDWHDQAFLTEKGWPHWVEALKKCHNPPSEHETSPSYAGRQRLVFDDFLAHQCAFMLARRHKKKRRGFSLAIDDEVEARYLKCLPFTFTEDQKKVLEEIQKDMASPAPMMRLLQGDVGSGKTVVAMAAMIQAASLGFQAALMAPTEVLAQQHKKTLTPLAEAMGFEMALITGHTPKKERQKSQHDLEAGTLKLVIGTHALFQKDLHFHNLRLVVIDEQHRFGVEQRLALTQKGDRVDVLSMTATPIPRTLMMTHYGDLDVSTITSKPGMRKPVETRVMSMNREEEVIQGLLRGLPKGHRAFWICPLIEESETLDLMAVEKRYGLLEPLFPGKVGLIHGRTPVEEAQEIMARFKQGALWMLVATTVVEVGVDMPDATLMIIEHAERFGLSALHQLRGRIGRGDKPGTCLLLYGKALSHVGRQRLAAMKASHDGFYLAEQDLHLRGGGDLLGARQSGFPAYLLADPLAEGELLRAARKKAKEVVFCDTAFISSTGMKLLLTLYQKEDSLSLLSAS